MLKRKLSIALSVGLGAVTLAGAMPCSNVYAAAAKKATVKSAIKNNYTSAINSSCILKPGDELNTIFKTLAGDDDASKMSVNSTIQKFAFSTETPSNAGGSTAPNIALKGVVYASFDSSTGTMTIYSPNVTKAANIYANPDSAWTFSGMQALTDVSGMAYTINYGKMTDGGRMFYDCSSLSTIDFTDIDISAMEYSDYMLNRCSSLEKVITPEKDAMNVEASIALPGVYKEKDSSGKWGDISYVSINATNPASSKTLYRYKVDDEIYDPGKIDPNAEENLKSYTVATGGSQTEAGSGFTASLTTGETAQGNNAKGSTGGSDSLYPGGGGYYGGGSGGTIGEYKFSGGGGSGYIASSVNGEDTMDAFQTSGENYGDGRVKITFIGVTDPNESLVYKAYNSTTVIGDEVIAAIEKFGTSGIAIYVDNGKACTAYFNTIEKDGKVYGYSAGGNVPSGSGLELHTTDTEADSGSGAGGKKTYSDLMTLAKDSRKENSYINPSDNYSSTLLRSESTKDVIGIAFVCAE